MKADPIAMACRNGKSIRSFPRTRSLSCVSNTTRTATAAAAAGPLTIAIATLNFSLRLQQLTTLKVNPEPIYLELTDRRLFEYPFLYLIEPGDLYFHEPEVKALRKYLLNGGFLMVDDFWGEEEWRNFYSADEACVSRVEV